MAGGWTGLEQRGKAWYNDREKHDLQARLDALRVLAQPALEQAGKTLETLGAEWPTAQREGQEPWTTQA